MARNSARDALRRVHNPPNPWLRTVTEPLGPPPEAALEVYQDPTRTALSRNDSPDVPFSHSVNPYRGCYHGCAYCYARPSHQYLDLGAGTDFERKLVVKPHVARGLREAFERPSWRGELVAFSGNTDCYQPLEASYGLTRACLEVCLAYRNPVGIVTKAALIERDLDLLVALSEEAFCRVSISVPFDDPRHARAIEPHAPSPARRYKVIERLARAGVPVGVLVSPVIPGLSDSQLGPILTRARQSGARFAGWAMVRLPGPVEEVFFRRMALALPLRLERVRRQIRACRAGGLSESAFGARHRGVGSRWAAIETLARSLARRLGYEPPPEPPTPSPFRRPAQPGAQLSLFD